MNKEVIPLKKCRELIEEKLTWGSSTRWQNQDFETLSERIFESTHTRLSTSTLKRLWGKIPYDSTPNLATLNALAQFIGHENWRAFSAVYGSVPVRVKVKTFGLYKPQNVRFSLLLCVLIVLIPRSLSAFWNYKPTLRFSNVTLSSRLTNLGLPTTAIFEYNAAYSNADSVFIQQNGNKHQRTKIDKHKFRWAHTYYFPGVYPTQLVLNDSVVKTHDLVIETDGWLGMVDNYPVPVYFPKTQVRQKEYAGITDAELEKVYRHFPKEIPWISLFNVQKERAVSSQNFVMEVAVRNTFGKGNGVCQHTKIGLLGTEGTMVIPLSIKGCVGELQVVSANELFEGSTEDLTGFGVDFKEWAEVRCEVKNNLMKIFVNQKLAFARSIEQNIGQIVGTRIQFMGTGEVRELTLRPL
jgi:hypothetical protein